MRRSWRDRSSSQLPDWAGAAQLGNIVLSTLLLIAAIVLGVVVAQDGRTELVPVLVLCCAGLLLFGLVLPVVLVVLVAMRNLSRGTPRPVWSAIAGVFGLGPALLWLLIEVVTTF